MCKRWNEERVTLENELFEAVEKLLDHTGSAGIENEGTPERPYKISILRLGCEAKETA